MRQVVLDTETTGLEPEAGHRIIEIGCLEMVNRQLTGKQFHYYINPEREVEQGALNVHGIDNAFLQDKPLFNDIVNEFIEFIHGAELIIHNAPFDVGFIQSELKKIKFKETKVNKICSILDTLTLARKLHPGQKNSLDALCKRYNVNNKHRDLHGALLDAELLAFVYLAMTGGQTNLFSDDHHHFSNQQMNEKSDIHSIQESKFHIPVVSANDQELKSHENRLAQIKQESGQCIWENMID